MTFLFLILYLMGFGPDPVRPPVAPVCGPHGICGSQLGPGPHPIKR